MNEAESLIKQGMAKIKVEHDYEMAGRIGLSKQTFSRRLKKPETFTYTEISALAKQFHWTDSELGFFVRQIGG